jgi:hypothetical protein
MCLNCFFNFEIKTNNTYMENTFYTTLEQVVLAQNPELFIYAHKLNKNMIPDMDHIFIRVYKDSSLFPQAPVGYKFKNPEGYATVKLPVIKHDKAMNQVLLSDGVWREAKHYNDRESSWIYDLEPIVEENLPAIAEDIF